MEIDRTVIAHAPRGGDPQWGPACIFELREATIVDRPQAVTCLACQQILRDQGYPGKFELPGDAVRILRGAILCSPAEVDGYLANFRREAKAHQLDHIGSVRTEFESPTLGTLVQVHMVATDAQERTENECRLVQCAIDGALTASNFEPAVWQQEVTRKLH
jgi:hypothetical protein